MKRWKQSTYGSMAAPVNAGVDVKPDKGKRLGVLLVDGQQAGVCASPELAALFIQAPRLHDALELALSQLKHEQEADPEPPPAEGEVKPMVDDRRRAKYRARAGAITAAKEAIAAWDNASKPFEEPLIQTKLPSGLILGPNGRTTP